ncbi:MAG: GAF domain-containing protein [Candidatus Omnitrophica bacterium]|nr:GAF domain-containing protein [Candidatus Omnitrophota bacterium]
MSIRTKLTITFLVLALVPVFFVSTVTFARYENSFREARTAHLRHLAAVRAERIEHYFLDLKSNMTISQTLYNIRKNLPILSDSYAGPFSHGSIEAKKMLDEQLPFMQKAWGLIDIELFTKDGQWVYATDPKDYFKGYLKPVNGIQEKAFKEGKNGLYFSDIFIHKSRLRRPELLISAPEFDVHGGFIGVIVFEVDMRPLYALINDVTGLGRSGEVLVGKKLGHEVVFLTPLRNASNTDLNQKISLGGVLGGLVQEAVQGKTGFGKLTDYRGKEVIAAWQYIPILHWGLVAKMDVDEAFTDIIHLKKLVFIILGIILILVALIAFVMAESIARPIRRLSEGAKMIGKGKLDFKVGMEQKDEIGDLSRIFDKMSEDLKQVTASRDDLNREIAARKTAQEKMERVSKRYELLAMTAEELLYAPNPQKIIDSLCHNIMDHLDCQVFFNFLADEASKKLHLNACIGIFEEEKRSIEWLDYGQAVCGCVARDGRRSVVECVPGCDDQRVALVKSYGIKAYACHPIIGDDGQVLGALSFGTRNRERFSEEELSLMKVVSEQVAVAIMRLKFNQALEKSEGRLKAIMEAVPVGVTFSDDKTCRHVTGNAAALAQFEVSGQDNLSASSNDNEDPGRNIQYFKDGQQVSADQLPLERAVRENRTVEPMELEIVLKKGRRWFAMASGAPICDDKGRVLGGVAVTVDITDRKKNEEILKQAKEVVNRDKEALEALVMKSAEELVEAQVELERTKRLSDIGTLAATVAHELRNPLAAIHMASYNLYRKAKNPALEKHFHVIQNKVDESDQIINNLLFYSRMKPPQRQQIFLNDILEESIAAARSRSLKNKVHLVKNYEDEGRLLFLGDPVQLKEVFTNIINNAFDAVREVKGEVKISSNKDGPFLCVQVNDTGPGIDEKILERVFDPFFTTKAQGTGLGLTVCRQIVMAHGGKIEMTSKKDWGTTVTVLLPLGFKAHV